MVAKPTRILRASVRKVTGKARHLLHGEAMSAPASVEVHQTDEGFFLLHIDSSGNSFADTWHETLESAQAQAAFEFEIDDWSKAS